MDRTLHTRAAWTHCCRDPEPTGSCRRRPPRGCTTRRRQRLRATAAAAPDTLGRLASPVAGHRAPLRRSP
eukprot:5867641-Prymnesium_polylepis.1